MLNFKPLLSLCVLSISAYAQGNQSTTVPDSVLHVNKTDHDKIEFRVGGSTVLAIGLANVNGYGKISWADYCQKQFQPGETATVPNAGQVATVITTSGVYGDKTAVDHLYRRYVAEQTVWHKWQDLATKSYSTDSKTFVEQITKAVADITVPPEPDLTTEENFGTWKALNLLKGNVPHISANASQMGEDPRKTILLYLAHMAGVYDVCVVAARSGREQ
jgi:hypothetical protein